MVRLSNRFRAGRIIAAMALSATAVEAAGGGPLLICGVSNVEDMVALPNSPWIIGSGIGDRFFQKGGLHLINEEGLTAVRLEPAMPEQARPKAPYDQCPGPVPVQQFSAHGLHLTANRDGSSQLFAVNHGGRESIEIFEVMPTPGQPRLSWIGCVLSPKTALGNAVAVRPDGELVLSASVAGDQPVPSFYDLSRQTVPVQNAEAGATPKGALFIWNRQKGWRKVPASERAGNNGIELSKDGKWAYVNGWYEESVSLIPLDPSLGRARKIRLDFKPDNIRWSYDGKLVTTGHVGTTAQVGNCVMIGGTHCAIDYRSAEIDPRTLQVTRLFDGKGTSQFGTATIGLKTKDALWLGSVRSACIRRVSLSDLRKAG